MADLDAVVTEIERHLDAEGWGRPPRLYALVRTADLLASEPHLAATLGDADPDSLTPVEQDEIGSDIADLLPRIEWPDEVAGCALAHEIVTIPDDVAVQCPDGVDPAAWAAGHAAHRDLRAVAAVLRSGASAATLRVRGVGGAPDEVVVDATVAPNMVAALHDTFTGGAAVAGDG
jgi:hypothetical protein